MTYPNRTLTSIFLMAVCYAYDALLAYTLKPLTDKSPFLQNAKGELFVRKLDCEYVRHWEDAARYVTIKLDGIHAKNVEPIGSMFIRVDGKIYDAFFPLFQQQKIARTNNIGNDIDVASFSVFDEEEQYFQDKNGLYYYERYPTSGACFINSPEGRYSTPIFLQKITLSSNNELALYRRQKNNIFLSEDNRSEKTFTPYARLDNALYWRNYARWNNVHHWRNYSSPYSDGQFIKVKGANPDTFRSLSSASNLRELFTDGRFTILRGTITEIKPETFREITYIENDGTKFVAPFFHANGSIYYLPYSLYGETEMPVKTDLDPSTFEVFKAIGTKGIYFHYIFRDKNFTYDYDGVKKMVEKQARS